MTDCAEEQEMEVEQAQFEEALNRLHSDVLSLSQYKDLTRVAQVTTHVQTIKNKLADAVAQGRLFNSREGLFNKEITEFFVFAMPSGIFG